MVDKNVGKKTTKNVENGIAKDNKSNKTWSIMLVLSLVFIGVTLFIMSNGSNILPTAFEIAGSEQATEDIEEKALNFINMSMLKPLWEGIWMGIFGILIALGLKKKEKFAWYMGMLWGFMMISNAAVQGGYEVLILGWSNVCPQTFLFLILGLIALPTLLINRKEF
ncbi:MAG: hypothetical protein JSV49_11930 [Thermoplasmata archaeon]|nr:MAG: hypothetical protein JSV49_11930 [Thermoplasmata archaeon]